MPSQLPYQTLPHHIHHHHQHCHCHCFPLLHRHHHHHLLFTKFDPSPLLYPCPLHHNHHHHHHLNSCSSNLHLLAINPRVISSIPPKPCPVPAGFFSGCPTVSTAVETLVSESGVQPMDQSEVLKLEDPGEEEELEDVFVLTDEWREFFAKSEAKRRMGSGGYTYLYEPLWWVGMVTMIVGEAANFAAYAFAPAILVTPLGALSIIVSAVLAHFMLNEKLHVFGILGCILCVVGSTTIVLHAPKEREIESVKEVWRLATEPGFLVYTCLVVVLVTFLIMQLVPRYGQTHMIVYIGICSLMGSLTVMSVKTVSIALKLTIQGMNQFVYYQTWLFTAVVIACIVTQLNYLNKALDTFNTAVISPVHYVMFSTFTILASMIMFKDWDSQNATQIATELCGFITILSGTFLLHKTMDMGNRSPTNSEPNEPNALNNT